MSDNDFDIKRIIANIKEEPYNKEYNLQDNVILDEFQNPSIVDQKGFEYLKSENLPYVSTGYPKQERDSFFDSKVLGIPFMYHNRSLLDHPNFESFTDGWFDENVMGLIYKSQVESDDPNTYLSDPNYNYMDDEQLENFQHNLDYFKYSTNEIRTKQLITKYFEELEHERNGPSYIIGRITGALTDPTSLLWFSKWGKYIFSGGRLKSSLKVAGAESIQETVKHIASPERTASESAWMIGGSAVFPLVFGNGFKYTLTKSQKKKIVQDLTDEGDLQDISGAINGNNVKYQNKSTNKWRNEDGETITIKPKTIKTKFKLNKDGTLNHKNQRWHQVAADHKTLDNGIHMVTVNESILKSMWKNKSWRKMKIKGVTPLKDFTSYEKFKEFVINHELTHTYIRPNATEKLNWKKGGKAAYENRVNKEALKYTSKVDNMWTHAKHFDVLANKLKLIEGIRGERFKTTILSKIGEGSEFNPVVRIHNRSSLGAMKIMERLVHLPYIRMKNILGIKTEHSVEEIINMDRFLLADGMTEITRQHTKWQKLNKNTPENRISSSEFRKRVSLALIDDTVTDNAQVMAAAGKVREFYDTWAKRIQSSGIMEHRVLGEIDFLKSSLKKVDRPAPHYTKILSDEEIKIWETGNYQYLKPYAQQIYKRAEAKLNKLKTKEAKQTVSIRVKYDAEGKPIYKEYNIFQIQKKITELEKYLAAVKKNIRRKNYLNIFVKRDRIMSDEAGFDAFVRKQIQKKYGNDINEEEIFSIIESYKGEQLFERATRHEVKLNKKFEDNYNMEVIMNPVGLSSHLKARKMKFDYEDWMRAGWIEDDIEALMQVYHRGVAPDVRLAEMFGDQTMWGGKQGYNIGIGDVLHEYKMKFKDARTKGSDYSKINAKQKIIQKEAEEVIRDLEATRDLIRGTYGVPNDPTRVFSKAVRVFKNFNAITQLTGALAALPDMIRMVMTSGFRRTLGGMLEQYTHRQWKTIMDMGMKETRAVGEGWDILLGTRAMAYADLDNIYGVFNKFEKGLQKFTAKSFIINLMSPWNQWAKAQAGINIMNRILEESINWSKGTISTTQKMKLAASGIDEKMARKIADEYKKHGQGKGGGYNDLDLKELRLAQSQLWQDLEAARALRLATQRDINISIVTPGKADTPLWMSTEAGSLIAQYKKFGMGAFNRMLVRGLQEGDASFYGGLLGLLLMGMLIDMIRHKAFDRDYSQTKFPEKLVNGIDRSGMLGIFMDVNNSIERLLNNKVGLRPIVGAQRAYGTDSFDKMGAILGPTVGQGEKLFNITTDWASGQHNHHTARNVRRLIPLQNVFYLDGIFDSFEQGIK